MSTTITIALLISVFSVLHGQEVLIRTTDGPQMRVEVEKSKSGGWLGVVIQDMSSSLAKGMETKLEEGALVGEVVKKSPAEAGGILEGDVIVEFNGRKIYDADDLVKTVGRIQPGSKVDIVVDRKGATKKLQVTIQKTPSRKRPAFAFSSPRGNMMSFGISSAFGAEFRELNEQLAEYFQTPDKSGVLVERVEEGSAAEKAGLKAGDVVIRIAKEKISTMSDISSALEDVEKGEKVDVEVIRKGSRKTLAIEVDALDKNHWYHFRTQPSDHMSREFEEEIEETVEEKDGNRHVIIKRLGPEMKRLHIEMEKLHEEVKNSKLHDDIMKTLPERVVIKKRRLEI